MIPLITGTDTDIGKTVATAFWAARSASRGNSVVIVKPVQTGLPPGVPGDAHDAARLAGLPSSAAVEFSRLPEPLAPTTAARRAGISPLPVHECADRIAALERHHDHVIVEGAGGLLVGLDAEGGTLLGLARHLRLRDAAPTTIVVARAGLGTLNHARLTCDAVRASGTALAGLLIGAWPASPGLAERCNRAEIAAFCSTPLLATLPEGLGNAPRTLRLLAESSR